MIDAFYESLKWQQARKQALRRDQYQDQYEKRFGRMRQAELVHHIFPRDKFPEYELELWNLISLSQEAHDQMHDRNTGRLTNLGEYWRRRTIPSPCAWARSAIR